MSDEELDQDLRRMFAAANEPLQGEAFEARFRAQLQKTSGWRGVPLSLASGFLGIVSGVGAGITAPFRGGHARKGLAALLIGLVVTGLTMLTA
jgi:hypothetical protein